jgi:cytoskeletal protein CcmA (bactofilin family)
VEAEIDARSIVILGAVSGKVIARRQLEIQSSGRFTGEATAASYEIRQGAVFEGISRMLGSAAKSANPSAPAAPALEK